MVTLQMSCGKRVFMVMNELFGSLRHLLLWQRALFSVFVLVLFCFSLFFSYRAFVVFYPTTTEQQEVFDYLYNDGTLSPEFGVRERVHLLDVKELMFGIDVLLAVLALLVVGLVRYLYSFKLLGQ